MKPNRQNNTIGQAVKSILLTSAVFTGLSAQTAMADSFTEALTGGKAKVDINVRYESVEQEGAETASALTERVRIGYETGDFKGVKGFIEMSGSESILDRTDYKVPAGSDANGSSANAVIADPVLTRLNQAYLDFNLSKSNIKIGKQRIVMDARFLGNVGWRQTEQVYSGLSAKINEFDGVKLNYAYIAESDNIFGVKTAMATHALKADISAIPKAKLSAYGYFIDNSDSTNDSQTVGARLTGKPEISDGLNFIYHLEAASQGDYADSSDVSASYYHFKAGLKSNGVTYLVAQESLGGDGSSSFQTPLATKHAYNGWGDKFLSTPANGLVDTYAKVATKLNGYKLAAIYHDYKADEGGDTYGSELNLVVATKVAKIYTVGAKYASYSADTYATNTSKLWVWGGVKF